MPVRAALYCRVSTREQRVEPQRDALESYSVARGLEVVEAYEDHGVSGAKGTRPGLDKLLADARRRRFDAVVCVKLDRLARSVRHLTDLAAEFEALGIDLIVLDQGVDTSTPAGRLLFNVLGSIAEFERDLIRERVSAGMQAAKRRGRRLGRPRAIQGPRAIELERMLADGASVSAAARRLGVSRATVRAEAERLSPH